jgi:hypothetical protein
MNILLIVAIVLLVLWIAGLLFAPGLGVIVNVVMIVGLILLILWLLKRFKVF